MPISSTVVTVTTAATLLTTGGFGAGDVSWVVLRNDSGVDIFIGPSNVTVATGLKVPTATTTVPLALVQGDALYAIVAAATQPLTILKTRA